MVIIKMHYLYVHRVGLVDLKCKTNSNALSFQIADLKKVRLMVCSLVRPF